MLLVGLWLSVLVVACVIVAFNVRQSRVLRNGHSPGRDADMAQEPREETSPTARSPSQEGQAGFAADAATRASMADRFSSEILILTGEAKGVQPEKEACFPSACEEQVDEVADVAADAVPSAVLEGESVRIPQLATTPFLQMPSDHRDASSQKAPASSGFFRKLFRKAVPAEAPLGEVGALKHYPSVQLLPSEAVVPLLSEAYDGLVEIAGALPCSGHHVLSTQKSVLQAIRNPRVAFEFRLSGAPFPDQWYPSTAISDDSSCAAVRVGVALCNRSGPLSDADYADWVACIALWQRAWKQSEATVIPEKQALMAKARDLDASCAQWDVHVALQVVPSKPSTHVSGWLKSHRRELNLVPKEGGGYVRLASTRSAEAQGLFTVSCGANSQAGSIIFTLDVPVVPAHQEPFGQMVGCAMACQEALPGTLRDESGCVIDQSALLKISEQLRLRYDLLACMGLPAGSPLAHRVFA